MESSRYLKHLKFFGGFLFISLLFLFSCKKEKFLDPEYLINRGDSIIIGDTTNMIVRHYNVTLYPYCWPGCTQEFPFDINSDGVTDFSFNLGVGYSSGCGSTYQSDIFCLNNNLKINIFYRNDTLYLQQDTTIKSYVTATLNVLVEIINTFKLNNSLPNDLIDTIYKNKKRVTPFKQNDILDKSLLYKSDSVLLNLIPCAQPFQVPTSRISNDTLFQTYTYYKTTIDCFPRNKIQYIGFTFADINGKTKLGWIKLDHRSNSTIILYETAIQK